MVIAFATQKGGSGKTTTAIHYAAHRHEAGDRVFLLDVDLQRHSLKRAKRLWHDLRGAHLPATELRERVTRALARGVTPTAIDRQEDYDVVVIDSPGNLDDAKPVFLVADLVVLPCCPSEDDLDSTVETLERIAEVRRTRGGIPSVLVFLNRVQERRRATQYAKGVVTVLKKHGVPVCRNAMTERAAIQTAANEKTLVWRVQNGGDAARDLRTVLEEIDEHAIKARELSERVGRETQRGRPDAGKRGSAARGRDRAATQGARGRA